MKKVILNLGSGTLTKGCELIIGEILEGRGQYPVRFTGQLPPAVELATLQQQWQQLYALRNQDQALRIHLLDVEGFRYSESNFGQVCEALVERFNDWLNSPAFRSVDQVLRTELERTEDVQLILEMQDSRLRRLPWHLWQLCGDYPRVSLTFSSSDWRPLPNLPTDPPRRRKKVNVLATFGNGEGLDLASDLATLSNLPETQLTVLESPSFNQLHDSLWQPEGWDIFFFAGHSQTQNDKGIIDLNVEDRLTIDQIKHALGKAISNGLKIAIFNSCDGLGLAQQLSELQIPYVVVMREPVPDHIAQQFLHYLLTAFAEGAPFHLAVREARQRLAGLDVQIPCASWLPVIWQNPTAPAIYWQDFLPSQAVPGSMRSWLAPAVRSAMAAGAVFGLRLFGLLELFELSAYDQLMRQRPAEAVDSRIVVVEISQEATSDYGYPLPDEVLTQLIQQISDAEPMAIGLDLHRPKAMLGEGQTIANGGFEGVASREVTTSYGRFLQQVDENPHLFLVCAYSSTDENYRAPLQLSDEMRINQVGFSDLPTDRFALGIDLVRSDLSIQGESAVMGNKVRRHLLSYDPDLSPVPSTCITPYSFSFQLAFQYLAERGVSPIEVTEDQHWQFGSVVFPSLAHRFGGYQKLEGPSSQLMLNYRANQPARRITLDQVLADNFEPALLRDRVVMIGYTAPVSKDYFETPYGPMAGLWVHAHMVSQLMSSVLEGRPLIRALPQLGIWQWGDFLWVVCWSASGAYASWWLHRRSFWLLSLLMAGVLLYGSCWVGLIFGFWLPLIPTALAMVVSVSWVRFSGKARSSLAEPFSVQLSSVQSSDVL
ncbi:MAG: CHASE2 domain-containing protein [Phormidesmis sp.]